ncbi:MAG: hypothetical protein R2780_14190 [Crocinitomicaceae bacterium]
MTFSQLNNQLYFSDRLDHFYKSIESNFLNSLNLYDTPVDNALIKEEAGWLLEQSGFPNFLEDHHVVFLFLEGHSFYYFNVLESDPEVFYWSYRLKGMRPEGKLSRFIEVQLEN